MTTMRFDDDRVPSWARAILFWRKILAVESRGIPGSLSGASHCAEGTAR